MLSGLLFGVGVDLTFMAMTNYITDAYEHILCFRPRQLSVQQEYCGRVTHHTGDIPNVSATGRSLDVYFVGLR
jgi:hypothetical protein